MKVGDLVKLTRDSDYQPQIFRRGMVGIVEYIEKSTVSKYFATVEEDAHKFAVGKCEFIFRWVVFPNQDGWVDFDLLLFKE